MQAKPQYVYFLVCSYDDAEARIVKAFASRGFAEQEKARLSDNLGLPGHYEVKRIVLDTRC